VKPLRVAGTASYVAKAVVTSTLAADELVTFSFFEVEQLGAPSWIAKDAFVLTRDPGVVT
jgi:hypothetical protein